MGLKTTNYKINNLGITLQQAYALIKDIKIDGISGYANIIVQTSRENALKVLNGTMQPLEIKRIDFVVNRNENDRITVYNTAKSQKKCKRYNTETSKMEDVVIDMPFYGWSDDYETIPIVIGN